MISLVVPTYNERQNVVELVTRTGKALAACGDDYELIIVDDNSPDGTGEEVRRLQSDHPWLRLVTRENARDLSTAVVAGWSSAIGDVLGCMDGDLQHPPENLIDLYKRQRETNADIVIASRYVDNGGVSDWDLHRRFVSWVATSLALLLLPSKIRRVHDPMSGFFLLKRSAIADVTLKPLGYKILLEVLARGRCDLIEEVPYVFKERINGGTKMGLAQVRHYLIHLLKLSLDAQSSKDGHALKNIAPNTPDQMRATNSLRPQ
jgi:dolichol-phosphate mannosyltransferase